MSVGEIAILGAGMHPWGKFVGKSFVDLGVHAARTALKDADVDWDEIQVVDHEAGVHWTKKCTHRLLIARVCLEEFDVGHYRASVKMREWTQERTIS